MRKTIAARLTEAKQTIPHFYLRREIRLDAAAGVPLAAQQGAGCARREALGQRLHHQGVGDGAAAGAGLQCGLGRRSGAAAEAVRRRGGGGHRGRPLHAGAARCRQEVALGAFGRDEGPRGARAQPQAGAARVSGRHFRDLESGHDGGGEFRCGDQSRRTRRSWRSARASASRSSAPRGNRGRDGDVGDAVGGSPRHRRRARARAFSKRSSRISSIRSPCWHNGSSARGSRLSPSASGSPISLVHRLGGLGAAASPTTCAGTPATVLQGGTS